MVSPSLNQTLHEARPGAEVSRATAPTVIPSFFLSLSVPLFPSVFLPLYSLSALRFHSCEQRSSVPRRVILGLFTLKKKKEEESVRFNKCLKSMAGDTGP